jgi:hypothetical protein
MWSIPPRPGFIMEGRPKGNKRPLHHTGQGDENDENSQAPAPKRGVASGGRIRQALSVLDSNRLPLTQPLR